VAAFGTQRLNRSDAALLCAKAYAQGFRIFDTALAYGNQAVVGHALRLLALPDIEIVSKIHADAIADLGTKGAIQRILDELAADRIGTVLIHSPRNVDHAAVLHELFELKARGIIGRVGVSNFTRRHLGILAEIHIVPDVLQNEIHPFLQEKALLQYCLRGGIAVMGHTAYGGGRIFTDEALRSVALQAKRSVAELILDWSAVRGVTPVVSTVDPLHVPAVRQADLAPHLVALIDDIKPASRICSSPAWSDFDD
jgi:diketogulonate reductase-like aldo/keto reductase